MVKDILLAYIALKNKVGNLAIFGTKTMGKLLWKNVNFLSFWTSCFYSVERRFLVVEYRKRHFPVLYCLKKESRKNGHFWTKTMGKLLWKNDNLLSFWKSCFYSVERRFFVVEYRKRHFPGLYFLKKESSKNGHFWTKTMGKMSIFWLF